MGRTEPPKGSQTVPLYYSNPDIVYANEFPAPRFGQGCFAAALDALYASVWLHYTLTNIYYSKLSSLHHALGKAVLLQH